MIPWSRNIRYLSLTLDPKLLFTKHLHTVTYKATGVLLQLFPLLARDSTLTILNKLTLYKLMICSLLTYAGTVWSNTSQSNYRHVQILQSKCLSVIGDYPRWTPIHYLHSTLSLEYIQTFIYWLTEKIFQQCTTHSNPLFFPNRKLLPTQPPRTVQKIHTQTHKTPLIVDLTQHPQCFLHCISFSLL